MASSSFFIIPSFGFQAAPNYKKLDTPSPPKTPPKLPKFGSYCFRAVVDMKLQIPVPQHLDLAEVPGWRHVGSVKGYDTSPEIAAKTEEACRAQARAVGDPGLHCGEASLAMIRPVKGTSCEGEMFFEMNGEATRVW